MLFFGVVAAAARGAGSRCPFFNLQPSEFAKIGVALMLAKFFGESRRGSPSTTDLAIGGAHHGACRSLLIAKEPDLGTASRWCPILLGIAFLAGMRLKLARHPAGSWRSWRRRSPGATR